MKREAITDMDIQALSGLIIAITGLIAAIGAFWHSVRTKGKVGAVDAKVSDTQLQVDKIQDTLNGGGSVTPIPPVH
jgi:hypothetical protein